MFGLISGIKILKDGSGDPHKAIGLHSSTDIGKTGKVTCLDWANAEQTECFLGKENQFLKVYSLADHVLTNNILLNAVPVGCVRLSE